MLSCSQPRNQGDTSLSVRLLTGQARFVVQTLCAEYFSEGCLRRWITSLARQAQAKAYASTHFGRDNANAAVYPSSLPPFQDIPKIGNDVRPIVRPHTIRAFARQVHPKSGILRAPSYNT